jgi:hypothetical protein
MDSPRKILHIDPEFKITYFIIIKPGTMIKSSLTLQDAVELLKKEKFELIMGLP